jgi:adenine-specific DNA-methyltransferase
MNDSQQDLRLRIRENAAFSEEEKNQLLQLLNDRKKYGLVWEDKPEDVEQLLREHLPVFVEIPELYIEAKAEIVEEPTQFALDLSEKNDGDNTPKIPPHHLLIEGDNLHALTALAFSHENKIDVIYIDPPYNTGEYFRYK